MDVGVRLESLGAGSSARYAVDKRLAQLLRVDLARARRLTNSLPIVLPVTLSQVDAQTLILDLEADGASASLVERPPGKVDTCAAHARFVSSTYCETCRSPLCVFCKWEGAGVCEACRQRIAKKRKRQHIRVAILLSVLFVVALFAWKELRRRSMDWSHPARVAVVLVESGEVPLDLGLVQQFRDRRQDVEQTLQREASRYYSPTGHPVSFSVLGPVGESTRPPPPPEGDLLSLLKFNFALDGYAQKLDESLGLDADTFDVRVYVRAQGSGGMREAAEGLGQHQGTIGVVQAQFSEAGIDFVWFVVCHEFFHTRGATDKYDGLGHSLNPEGLYDPDQTPTYPQPGTEVMARGQPIAHGKEELPGEPATWSVGKWTAREIGWLSARTH